MYNFIVNFVLEFFLSLKDFKSELLEVVFVHATNLFLHLHCQNRIDLFKHLEHATQ